jgi:hypothetical protein
VAQPHVGDIFTVPLRDDRCGLGQVAGTWEKHLYLFVLFDPAFPNDDLPQLDAIPGLPVAFVALAFDALIHHGRWSVIGNRPVADHVPYPVFREGVGTADGHRVDVVDYAGTRRRPATAEEAARLPNRTFYSPAVLGKALAAHHGLAPWNDDYAEFGVSAIATTRQYFGDSPAPKLQRR